VEPDVTRTQQGACYPLAVVTWEDASNVASWMDVADAIDFENHCDSDFNCTNVGYLIRDDETCVIVAARATLDHRAVGLIERIPRGMVRSVRIIDKPKGGAK
jgi:hypothetical protein